MIESTITHSASKLFEALERLSQSAGSGLASGGPSGQPSDELIKQFQEAMKGFSAEAGQNQESQAAQGAQGVTGLGVEGVNGAEAPDAVQAVDGLAQPEKIGPGPAEHIPPVEETPDVIQVEYVVDDGHSGVNRLQSLADTAGSEGVTGENTGEAGRLGTEKTSEAGDISFADAGDSSPLRARRVSPERQLHVPGTENTSTAERSYTNSSNNQEDLLREMGEILQNITKPGASILPAELFRLQYLTGMLKVGSQTGLKASQQATQGMESVLKQNG